MKSPASFAKTGWSQKWGRFGVLLAIAAIFPIHVHAQTCTPPSAGIVGWWPGNGNATDIAGGNNGTLVGSPTYVTGEVGQAFSFNGNGQGVTIGNPAALQLQNFTIDAWIQRGTTTRASLSTGGGLFFAYGSSGYGFGVNDNGQLFLSQIGVSEVVTNTAIVSDTSWHHVAVTKNGNVVVFYVDGVAHPAPAYSPTFGFGTTASIGMIGNGTANSFLGNVDEMDVFNRPLGATEIQAIYNAGTAGKCTSSPPAIVTQPAGQSVVAGQNTGFSVVVAGDAPFSYQWQLNNANVSGATASALNIPNVQTANAGSYTVIINNSFGSITSSPAILTVNTPVCVSSPSGLVGWWPGDGDAADQQSQFDGTPIGGAGFTTGQVGQCFSFNGNGQGIFVGNPTALQLQSFTIEAWIQRSSPTQASLSTGGGAVFSYGTGGYGFGLTDGGQLYLSASNSTSSPAPIVDTLWHHVAVTKNGSAIVFYVDGAVFSIRTNTATFSFTTPAAIGAKGDSFANSFLGNIDEVDIFNRALAATEIQSIYNASSAGKCSSTPPSITTQPANATVASGISPNLTVLATGTEPLSYQWQFNNANISGATSSILTLADIQPANAGNYTVVVANAYGSVTGATVSITVTDATCVTPPAGLLSWWQGEGTGNDTMGGNNGAAIGSGYVTGEVGQAFSFTSNGQGISVGSPASLQLQNFSIDAWVRRSSTTKAASVLGGGMIFAYGQGGYGFGMNDNGQLFLSKISTDEIASGATVTDLAWHHVAVTKNGTAVMFYVDGVAYSAAAYNSTFTFTTPAAIGAAGANENNTFLGAIDELDVFNRALAATEVQSIFYAGTAGKCSNLTPSILTQPLSGTVTVGNNTSFSVLANGTQPLTYQWQFNNANISGATTTSLTLANVQLAAAGNYTVVINNTYGSVTSSVAALTVNPPVCTTPPTGLVSWWPAENSTVDVTGGHNGTLVGSVAYVAGEVGQAFIFNGNGEAVSVGNPVSLQLQNFTIDAWIQRGSTTQASLSPGGGMFFAYGAGGYSFGVNDNGTLYLSAVAANELASTAAITDLGWHHVAITKNGSTVIFYVDGVAYPAGSYTTSFGFNTSAAIGARGDNQGNSFLGAIDELDIFNRALNASEVQAIYNTASAGKCNVAPPTITTQPASETVATGNTATFSVSASGGPPLSYQWQFNNANINGATSSSLSIPNAQPANAGNYTVIVSNPNGSTTSSVAVLTVNTLACATPPSGLISWWPGDSDGQDQQSGYNGTPLGGVTFVAGEVSQAFSFNGNGQCELIGNPPALQLQNFTIDAWIKRSSTTQASTTGGGGMILAYGSGGYSFGVNDNGTLFLSAVAASEVATTAAITDMAWHHVAVTKNGGTVIFYVDGLSFTVGNYSASFGFSTPIAIGARGDNQGNCFMGAIDEVDVYNRALASSEIQSIYNAGPAGKCSSVPPTITTQPASQTVAAGNTASFVVGVTGSEPLNYQWQFNNANIDGATASSFTLLNVQPANAGNYTVVLNNAYGSVTSSIAVLTVGSSSCDPAPSGLVSWWPGNGTTADLVGNNSGTLTGGATYVAGKVGQAFSFNGNGQGVVVGNPAGLQVQNFTIDAWIQRGSATKASISSGGGMVFSYGSGGYGFGVTDNGQLYLSAVTGSEITSTILVTDLLWHHVAVSMNSGTVVFYVDGVANSAGTYSVSFGFGTPAAIGARGDNLGNCFLGAVDEVDVFNRALTAAEVSSIYNASSSGKCNAFPPTIFTQPASETVAVGNTANFSVVAGGTVPLSYQWQFNNANISGATASALAVPNAQFANAGNYSVIVANAYGMATSATAVLNVDAAGCTPAPAGLVSWWPAEGNTHDIVAANNGTAVGTVTYVSGEAGQAFSFNSSGSGVVVGNPIGIQLQNFTIDAWLKRSSTTQASTTVGGGMVFSYGASGYGFGLTDGGLLYLSCVTADEVTSAAAITDMSWHHAAVTKSGNVVTFYVDGTPYAAAPYNTTFTFGSTAAIGARGDNQANSFLGAIDELDVFNRALATTEIQAIFAAAANGKCTSSPPQITTPPASLTVVTGQTAAFSVTAAGLGPLTYQWKFNNANIGGATISSLTLNNVQTASAGSYTVVVGNSVGSVTSSPAVLTVNSPVCVAPASGLVGWWPGEGSTVDSISGNVGTVVGAVNYVSGEVGQAFSFNGNGEGFTVGNPTALQLQNFTIDAWIQRGSTSKASSLAGGGAFLSYGSQGYGFGLNDNGVLYLSQIGASEVVSSRSITDTAWHHVAVTKNGGTVIFYLDGVANPPINYGAVFAFQTSAGIGMAGNAGANSFLGNIDEVDVFNRPLAASDIQAIYNSSSEGKCPIGPAITGQPANVSVALGGTAVFSVTSGGSPPLSYQWQFNNANISGATASSLNLANVQYNQAGNYSVIVMNVADSATSSVATLTVQQPPTLVQAVNVTATSALITVPVDLVAVGTENALGLSVDFDPTALIFTSASLGSGASGGSLIVNSNQAASGKLGLEIALSSDTTFTAGTNDVVDISFLAVAKTTATTTSIAFGDSPTLRQVSDADADVLAANYATGIVTIPFLGIEGDVTPLPNGDNTVTTTDWVKEGRFVAGLDTITDPGEFQRADCAPRETLGDGTLTVADWVQVGRYAAGLDTLTAGGGPTQPSGGNVKTPAGGNGVVPAGGPARSVAIGSTNAGPGQTCQVSLVMNSQGNENAVGCSVNFDPAVLSFVSASLGSGAPGATLNVNTKQAPSGTVGLALALPTGSTFSAASQELARLKFTLTSSATNGSALTLSSTPVARAVADASAHILSTSYVNGMIAVTSTNGAPTISVTQFKGSLMLSWPASATGYNLESSSNAVSPSWSPVAASLSTNTNTISVTVPISGSRQFYRLHHP